MAGGGGEMFDAVFVWLKTLHLTQLMFTGS